MLKKTGFNFISVPDKAEVMRVLTQVRPPASLFYSAETSFAAEVKAAFPEMDVLIRFWPDEDVHTRFSPQEWITMHAAESRRGLTLYTNNESGLSDAVIGWNLEVAHKAVEFSRKIVCLNPAAGTYEQSDMARLRPLLELAGLHPDIVTIGLHAYAGGAIISGMFKPEDLDKRINPLMWPTRAEIDKLFPFHIGRQRMISDYCRTPGVNIKVPRMVYTETGFDRTGDIAGWLNKLTVAPGCEGIDGWKSLKDQWRSWWPEWTPEMALIKQFQYAETNLMRDIAYALFYCYGNDGDSRWQPFRIDNTNVVTYMEGQPQVPDVTPPEPVVTPPVVIESPVVVVPPKPAVDTLPAEVPVVNPDVFKLVASMTGTEATVYAIKAILDGYNALAKLNNLPVLSIQVQ